MNSTAQHDAASQMWVADAKGTKVSDRRGPGWAEQRLAELLRRMEEIEKERRPPLEAEVESH